MLVVVVALLFVAPVGQAKPTGDEPPSSDYAGMPPLGQAVAYKSWTWTVVDERGIALGGGGLEEDDVGVLAGHGFGAVLNVRLEHEAEEQWFRDAGLAYRYVPIGYAEEDIVSIEEIEASIAFIQQSLEEGKWIYVHCTGGWHRSASMIVALFMKENGWRYEEAWAHLERVRPGIEPRYSESLLLYEQHLFGGEKLTVDLWATHEDVQPGETVPVEAYVRDGAGRPVEGARLVFDADYFDVRGEATSDAEGRASFTFTANDMRMQFVHVWAQKDGYLDGYDRNDFWHREVRDRAPTTLRLEGLDAPVEPGAPLSLHVMVGEGEGRVANALVTLTYECGQLFRDYTGWDSQETITFDAPLEEGTYTLHVRANRFAAEPVDERVELVVGAGGPAAPCPAPEPEPQDDELPPPLGSLDGNDFVGSLDDLEPVHVGMGVGAAALGALIALGLVMRRRPGG